jgi:endonuclease-8
LIDGRRVRAVDAVGKHLLYVFSKNRILHVHLGRFGHFDEGPLPLPEPHGILRFRMYTKEYWYELRGAIAIDIYDAAERTALEARIGPNPLDPADSPTPAFARVVKSKTPIGVLLMDQSVIAGVGNIYRSEVLFLNRVHPKTPGTELSAKTWRAIWKDLVRLMADGARVRRIVTTWPKDRAKPQGPVRRDDRFYVYHREGLPCRHCGAPIRSATLANRSVFWCPVDQPEHAPSGKP